MERLGPARRAAPLNYVEAVQRAGGLALMLPPDEQLVEDPSEVLDADRRPDPRRRRRHRPGRYGSRADPQTSTRCPSATRFEIALARGGDRARHAAARHLPRHAADQRRLRRHAAPAPARPLRPRRAPPRGRLLRRRRPRRQPAAEGSLAAPPPARRCTRPSPTTTRASTASASGLVVSGVSALDDLPEAIELPDRRFVLGVQWHPEADRGERAWSAALVAGRRRAPRRCRRLARRARRERARGRRGPSPILTAQCGCRRRSERPPGGWSRRASPRRCCASASPRPPLVDAGGRLRRAARAGGRGAPLAAGATSRSARCRCGPTWPPTRPRTTTPRRRRRACTSTTRSSPTACSASGELPSARLQRALARIGPEGPEWRALDRVLVWAHWSWFAVPHGSLAYILVRRPERFPRAAVMTYAVFDIGASVYWLAPTAPPWYAAGAREDGAAASSRGAAHDGRVRRAFLGGPLGLALQCLRRQSSRCDALSALRHIRDGRAPARRGGAGAPARSAPPTRRRSASRSSTWASTTWSTCWPGAALTARGAAPRARARRRRFARAGRAVAALEGIAHGTG